MSGIAAVFSRWGFWWFAAWAGLAIWSQAAAESCRSHIATTGEACTGLEASAYENSGMFFIVAMVIAIGGGLLLGRLQDRADTHACPRCGARVPNGMTACSTCGFDASA